MNQPGITFKAENGVGLITLRGLSPVNGANGPLAVELAALAEDLALDSAVRAVVITGLGSASPSGNELDRPDGVEQSLDLSLAGAVAGLDRPTIAVLDGLVSGQGLELALACDLRLASENTQLALDQLARGQMPADGGSQRLPRLIGPGRALDMLLTGRAVPADQALDWGLVNRIAPRAELLDEALALARKMAGAAFAAVRHVREAVLKGLDLTTEQGLRLEADLYFLLHTTDDRREGIEAFTQKRKPVFKGE